MKKKLTPLILGLLLGWLPALNAQEYGVKAGLNLAKFWSKEYISLYHGEFLTMPGFHAGFTLEMQTSEIFSFETGLILSAKGTNYERESQFYYGHGGTSYYKTEKSVNLYYLEIPALIKITGNLGTLQIFATAGPYIGIGVSGKYKYVDNNNGQLTMDEFDVTWSFNSEDGHFKRFDTGLSFGGGIGYKDASLGASYGLGLMNITAHSLFGSRADNRVISISLGYRLGNFVRGTPPPDLNRAN